MTFGRKGVAGVALLVLLAVGGALIWWRAAAGTSLETTGARIGGEMILPRTTTDFTMGQIYIERPGSEVEVLEVKPRTSPNVQYLGAFTVWPRDLPDNNVGSSYQFPPRQPFDLAARHPLSEVVPALETAHIPAGDFTRPPPVGIFAGFRIVSGSVAAVDGIEVVYRVDGRKVREYFDQVLFACVKPDPCSDAPDDDLSSDEWRDETLRQFGLLRDES